MTVLERKSTKTTGIGVSKIRFCEGDFRESPYCIFTFFRDDKNYVVTMQPESAEILMELLNITKSDIGGE